jgi:hypothetical protein
MRVPQVSERIKEAPAQALRGVFAGIGQLLLVTDKLRNKTPASAGVPRTRAPEAADPAAAPKAADPAAAPEAADPAAAPAAAPAVAEPAAADPTPALDADVKPEVVVVETPAAAQAVAAEPAAAEPAAAEPAVVEPAPAKGARPTARKSQKKPPARDFDKTGNVRLLTGVQDAEAAASDAPAVPAETPPPLPSYDELSIASLRARLRNLDIPQLKQVADYERSHLGRAEVIAMFERRVAKLEAEPVAKPEAGA